LYSYCIGVVNLIFSIQIWAAQKMTNAHHPKFPP
jgi:hypothetical protein